LAAAAAQHPTTSSNGFVFYPNAGHPFSISALFAAERFNQSKNTSIADLRLKAQKYAAALGL
jgi:hypothetical protein